MCEITVLKNRTSGSERLSPRERSTGPGPPAHRPSRAPGQGSRAAEQAVGLGKRPLEGCAFQTWSSRRTHPEARCRGLSTGPTQEGRAASGRDPTSLESETQNDQTIPKSLCCTQRKAHDSSRNTELPSKVNSQCLVSSIR